MTTRKSRIRRASDTETFAAKPARQRLIDFPLVTLALMVLAVGATMTLAQFGLQRLFARTDRGLGFDLLRGVAVPLLLIAVYKVLTARIGADRTDALPFDRRAIDLARGAGLAFVLMSAIVGVAALLGAYRISGWGHLSSWRDLLFAGGTSAAVIEEIAARGILFRYLEASFGSWAALAASAAMFGAAHFLNPNATAFSSAAIAIEAGIMLGGAYMLTRNLWLAIGIHFGWNVTQGLLWDVPVSGFPTDGIVDAHAAGPILISGGAFGLEGSVVALVAASAVGAAIVVAAARRGQVMLPWWTRRQNHQTKL